MTDVLPAGPVGDEYRKYGMYETSKPLRWRRRHGYLIASLKGAVIVAAMALAAWGLRGIG